MGEQPHPWPLLQDQDGKSRHRNLFHHFWRDQTMSSPPALPSIGGSAYDGLRLVRATRFRLSHHVGTRRAAWQLRPSHWPHDYARLSRYGVIRIDRPSTCWTKTTTNSHRPALSLDGSSWSRPCIRHPLGQRMLPGDVVHFEPYLSLSFHG
jgi:hypothetical protein